MENNSKRIKEKKYFRSGKNIWVGLASVLLAAFVGLKGSVGATLTAVVGVLLGYKLLSLVLRVLCLVCILCLMVISMVTLSVIISVLIF